MSVIPAEAGIHFFVIPAEAGIQFFVIPAEAGIHSSVIPAKAGIHFDLAFSWFGSSALRENRLTSVCVSSAIHGGRLLSFACPKESNQRKRHPRIRAARAASGSLRANGFGRQAIHGLLPNRRDPSRRPRACTRLFRSPFAAAQRDPRARATASMVRPSPERRAWSARILRRRYKRCRICGFDRFCGRDCRALLLPGPSRPRRAGAGSVAKRWPAGCRPVRPQYTDVLWANPGACSRSSPARMPADRGREGVSLLVTSLWTSKEK